jgi:hypothetical protein
MPFFWAVFRGGPTWKWQWSSKLTAHRFRLSTSASKFWETATVSSGEIMVLGLERIRGAGFWLLPAVLCHIESERLCATVFCTVDVFLPRKGQWVLHQYLVAWSALVNHSVIHRSKSVHWGSLFMAAVITFVPWNWKCSMNCIEAFESADK